MGKYSLDAFETHPLVKLRPPMAAPGDTSFTLISSPAEARGNGPFVLRPELPGGPDAACAALAQMACIPSGNVRPDAVVASGCGFPEAALPATQLICPSTAISEPFWISLFIQKRC